MQNWLKLLFFGTGVATAIACGDGGVVAPDAAAQDACVPAPEPGVPAALANALNAVRDATPNYVSCVGTVVATGDELAQPQLFASVAQTGSPDLRLHFYTSSGGPERACALVISVDENTGRLLAGTATPTEDNDGNCSFLTTGETVEMLAGGAVRIDGTDGLSVAMSLMAANSNDVAVRVRCELAP